MKHLQSFESFQLHEAFAHSINDHGKKNLVGKNVKFPNGKLKLTSKQWRGDYSSMSHYEEKVDPNEIFTVTKLEKVYWGSRGEKSTAPLLFVKDKNGKEYMLSTMDYEPVEVVD
jgi:hypothetical protein